MTNHSFITYVGDGTDGPFTIPFSYIDSSHVAATVDGVAAGFAWLTGGSVRLDAPAAGGALVEFRRTTPRDDRLVDFTDGSILLEADLDKSFLQQLYIAQEVVDAVENSVTLASDGTYDAGGKRISNLADPVADQDAATKSYADATVSAASAAASAAAASATAAAASESGAAVSASAAAASAAAAATFDPEAYYDESETDALLAGKANASHTHAKSDISDLAVATETVAGLVEKSTSGENTTGTATDVFPDVAGVKEMIDTHAAGGGGAPGLIVQDQKSAGTSGGASSATTNHTRDLNTVVRNEISGASLASDQITLPAGSYYVEFETRTFKTGIAQGYLYNVDDSAVEINGTIAQSASTNSCEDHSHGSGVLTLAAEKDLELRMYTHLAQATNGLGYGGAALGSNDADGEVYSTVKIWEI